MKNDFELEGKSFNDWTVLKRLPNKRCNRYWLCQCKCGRTSKIPTYYLTKGYSTKCVYCAKHTKDIYKEGLPDVIWNRVKWNAKKRNVPVLVSKEEAYDVFVKQNKKCNLTGMDIRLPLYGTDKEWTASLDRIDAKKGYMIGNIQWVHKDLNRIKNIFDEKYFISICQKVVNFCGNRYDKEEIKSNNNQVYHVRD